jgi:hypothetical protein
MALKRRPVERTAKHVKVAATLLRNFLVGLVAVVGGAD